MPVTSTDPILSRKLAQTCLAGGIASFLTQPLEVIKTNMINSPNLLYADLHRSIMSQGWKTYMRGGSIAVVRQSYGFAFYSSLLATLERALQVHCPGVNKFYKYSASSLIAKLAAMAFEAPLTLLKTRLQLVTSSTLRQECLRLLNSPLQEYTKGLGTSIVREGMYTFFHYNTYRLLKDDVFYGLYGKDWTFIPAFFAGVVAITVSQPFEVIRSKISLSKCNEPIGNLVQQLARGGWRGFFVGYLPRLCRKPINSGICWTVLEWTRRQ